MASSIKLQNNNYWDSSGIVHNQELLSSILTNVSGLIDMKDDLLKLVNVKEGLDSSLDGYYTTGTYYFDGSVDVEDKPDTNTTSYGFLYVKQPVSNFTIQTWVTESECDTTTKIYARHILDYGTWSPWQTVGTGEILYNNSTGSNGTITLNRDVSNYNYLEIFYRDSDNSYYNTRVYNPNTKYVSLSGFDSDSTTAMWIKTRRIYINGTSISTNSTNYCEVKLLAGTPTFSKSNYIYITQVIGYL